MITKSKGSMEEKIDHDENLDSKEEELNQNYQLASGYNNFLINYSNLDPENLTSMLEEKMKDFTYKPNFETPPNNDLTLQGASQALERF